MSYILDALRKADAQRERARAPGLHDQPLELADTAPPRRAGPVLVAGGFAVLVVAGLLAWALSDPAAPPVAATAPAVSPSVAAPVAAVAQVQPPSSTAAPAAGAALPAAPAEPAQAVLPPPAPAVLPPPAPAPVAVAPVAPARAAVGPASAAAPAAAKPAAAASSATPATVPEALATTAPPGAPRLAISGGVWSPNPAQRMLVVGGQVAGEGSELAPGLVLEQVRQGNRAVLNWQGQRWVVAY
jgi:general secretion pathway protein B